MTHREKVRGIMQGVGTLDGAVPDFEHFTLGLREKTKDCEEALRIMRNMDRGGLASWLKSSKSMDEDGKKKRQILEDLKKKFTPSIKSLVKDAKTFCQEEASATSHIRNFGGSVRNILFDRESSLASTSDAISALARVLKDADRSEGFLTSHFTRTVESMNRAMPDIVDHLEEILNSRERLYKTLCSQRDQYDSTLDKARKKRQKKGGLFGFGQKQQFNNAPELDDDVVEKRQCVERTQKDFDTLSKYCDREFNAQERRREALLVFCVRELVAIQQMKLEVMLTGYARILKTLPSDSAIWRSYGFESKAPVGRKADDMAAELGEEISTSDLPPAPKTTHALPRRNESSGASGANSRVLSKSESGRRPPVPPSPPRAKEHSSSRPSSTRNSRKERPAPPKVNRVSASARDMSSSTSVKFGDNDAPRSQMKRGTRSVGDVLRGAPKIKPPSPPTRRNKTCGDVLAAAHRAVDKDRGGGRNISAPLSREGTDESAPKNVSRGAGRSKPPKRPSAGDLNASVDNDEVSSSRTSARKESNRVANAISEALSVNVSPQKKNSRPKSTRWNQTKSTSPSPSSQLNFAEEAMAALKKRRSRKSVKRVSAGKGVESSMPARSSGMSPTTASVRRSSGKGKTRNSDSSSSSMDIAAAAAAASKGKSAGPNVKRASSSKMMPGAAEAAEAAKRRSSGLSSSQRRPAPPLRRSNKSMADLKKSMQAKTSQSKPPQRVRDDRIDVTGVPGIVAESVVYLERHGLDVEGVFRINGDLKLAETILNECRGAVSSSLSKGKVLERRLGNPTDDSVRTVASLIKMHFRKLDKPLFPLSIYSDVLRKRKNADHLSSLLNDGGQMPASKLASLKAIMHLCCKISERSDRNRMTPNALSICWAPSLLRAPPSTSGDAADSMYAAAMDAGKRNQVIETIISNFGVVFRSY